ncbi:hypothetical protein FF2_002686 [Malus domestica]
MASEDGVVGFSTWLQDLLVGRLEEPKFSAPTIGAAAYEPPSSVAAPWILFKLGWGHDSKTSNRRSMANKRSKSQTN